MATLYVLSNHGDQRISWSRTPAGRDPETLAAIAEAEALFAEHRRRGSSAFKLVPGQPAERLDSFDPTAEDTVIIPRMVGG